MSSAGKFTIEVSLPYPCWVRISYDGRSQEIHGIRHTELRDLEYALGRAIKEARDLLPESFKHEMD